MLHRMKKILSRECWKENPTHTLNLMSTHREEPPDRGHTHRHKPNQNRTNCADCCRNILFEMENGMSSSMANVDSCSLATRPPLHCVVTQLATTSSHKPDASTAFGSPPVGHKAHSTSFSSTSMSITFCLDGSCSCVLTDSATCRALVSKWNPLIQKDLGHTSVPL